MATTSNLLDDPRVSMAAERTLLAWVRTGLAMMGFGFVIARFGLFLRELHPTATTPSPSSGESVLIGAGLVVCGVLVNILAVVSHLRMLRQLQKGDIYRPSVFSLSVVTTLMMAVLGVVLTLRLLLANSG